MPVPFDANDFVTVGEYRWSLGLLITAMVSALVAIFLRLIGCPSRKEMREDIDRMVNRLNDKLDTVLDEREKYHDRTQRDLQSHVDILHGENREALRGIREDVRRLEGRVFIPGQSRE